MGVLDDAIREHLDLKRRRGADPDEIERDEREALGPVRRGPEQQDQAGSDADEDLEYGEQELEEPSNGDAESAPAAGPFDDEAERSEAPRPLVFDDEAATSTREALEPFPADEEPFPADEPFPAEEPFPPDEPPPPAAAQPPPAPAEPADEAAPAEAAPRERAPEAAPAEPEHADQTVEYDVEHALEHEPPPKKDDDPLEETPEFLQDTPDHDRLWFEQKPPRDFDFDK
jgi:hypothetical protein